MRNFSIMPSGKARKCWHSVNKLDLPLFNGTWHSIRCTVLCLTVRCCMKLWIKFFTSWYPKGTFDWLCHSWHQNMESLKFRTMWKVAFKRKNHKCGFWNSLNSMRKLLQWSLFRTFILFVQLKLGQKVTARLCRKHLSKWSLLQLELTPWYYRNQKPSCRISRFVSENSGCAAVFPGLPMIGFLPKLGWVLSKHFRRFKVAL